MTNYTGRIDIYGANFWAFLFTMLPKSVRYDHRFESPKWTGNGFNIVVIGNPKESYTVDSADFWAWIVENHVPNSNDKYAFNTPIWDEDTQSLSVEFAADRNLCPPFWGDDQRPEWVKNSSYTYFGK